MAKRKKRKVTKSPTYWQDLGDGVFDGIGKASKALAREVTFRPDSLNQRAMQKVAAGLTAATGVAAYAGSIGTAAGSAVGSAAGSAYNGIENGINSYHDRIWGGKNDKISGPKE